MAKNKCLDPDGVFFSVGVSAVRRDDVQDPAEQEARPKPESRSENQPQNPREDAAVVNLPKARKNQTQNTSDYRIAHRLSYLHSRSTYDSRARFVRSALAVNAPHVDDLATEGLQHRLNGGIALGQLAQALFLQSLFILAAERLARS